MSLDNYQADGIGGYGLGSKRDCSGNCRSFRKSIWLAQAAMRYPSYPVDPGFFLRYDGWYEMKSWEGFFDRFAL